MRAIVLTATNTLDFCEVLTPIAGPGEALIKTAAFGICATDLEMIAGDPRVKLPAILGHEWSGIAAEVGEGVDHSLVGMRCVAENIRRDGGEVGFEHPGAYGEYFVTDAANVHSLPEQVPFVPGVLLEPLAVCLRGVRRLQATSQDNALIFGDGPIGLLSVALLKHCGYRDIWLAGGRTHRLGMAEELGASRAINYHTIQDDLGESILREHGSRFNNVIEASGSGKAMQASLDVAGKDGHILVIGDYGKARADFRWNQILHYELHIIGSNASQYAWEEAVQLAGEGKIPLEKLVTHRFSASDYQKGFEIINGRDPSVIKVVVEWDE